MRLIIIFAIAAEASRLSLLIASTKINLGYPIDAFVKAVPDAISTTAGIFVTMAVASRMEASAKFIHSIKPVIKLFSEMATAQHIRALHQSKHTPLPQQREKHVKEVMKKFTGASLALIRDVVQTHKVLPTWVDISSKVETQIDHIIKQIAVLASSMEGLAKQRSFARVMKARHALIKSFILSLLEILGEQESRVIERDEPKKVVTKQWAHFIVSYLKSEALLARYTSLTASLLYRSLFRVERVILNPHNPKDFAKAVYMEIFSFFIHEAAKRQNLPNMKLKMTAGIFPGDAELLQLVPRMHHAALMASEEFNRVTTDLVRRVERLWKQSVIELNPVTEEDIKQLSLIKDQRVCEQMNLTLRIASESLSHLTRR